MVIKMKLSDYIVCFFKEKGVEDIFMVTGGGCMHLVNSFGNSATMKYWCTHHEQAAAMAAEGYSKMKNDVGLVLVTSGPGATNTITGVLDCYQDSTPVIFISGQAKSKQTVHGAGIPGLRQFGVQEADIVSIVQGITKMAVEITDPCSIRYYLEKAFYEATNARPGPVWLSIPLDVQSSEIEPFSLRGYRPEHTLVGKDLEEKIQDVRKMIQTAKRPVIIAGHGIRLANGCPEFSKAVADWGIPVVTPFMGIDVVEENHPCNIGRVGTKGTRAGNFAMQNADLIISIGSRLAVSVVGHEYNLFARDARIVIVDVDGQEHKKRTIHWNEFLLCDAKTFVRECFRQPLPQEKHTPWLEKCQYWKKKYPVILKEYENDSHGLNYYKFIDLLNKHTDACMPIIADAGSAFYVTSQAIKLKKGQRYITAGGTATMGFTVPAAIGVAVASPAIPIIAITGDGSFMQNLQELEVIRHQQFNIKLFVMNNGGYFSIRQTQNRYFQGNLVGESSESGISFPSMGKIAEAFEIPFYTVGSIQEAEKIMEKAFAEVGPVIVEVKTTHYMEIIPTNAAAMREDGTMISKPLEDMYPFLERDEFNQEMIVTPVNLE